MNENIVEDQVQEDVSEDSTEASDTSQEQSETTTDESEAKAEPFFVDHLGRQLTPEQLKEEYTKTQSYVTKLEQAARERDLRVQQEAADAVGQNELLQDVDPNVAEAIKQIVTPVIQDALKQRDLAEEQKARDNELRQRFASAEQKYDGKNGYPKFQRDSITTYMLQNEVYDPERAYLLMNRDAIIDAEVRKAMKGKDTKGTESTKGGTPIKPEGKSPKTFEEASRRAASRI
jgi:hypothetical protein